jgi:hypothetical protein
MALPESVLAYSADMVTLEACKLFKELSSAELLALVERVSDPVGGAVFSFGLPRPGGQEKGK